MNEPLLGRCHVCGKVGQGHARLVSRYGKQVQLFTCNGCLKPPHQSEVKAYIDPAIAGTAPKEFVRSQIEDLPISPKPRPEEEEMEAQRITKLKELCDRMVADGVVLNASEVGRQVCGLSNWVHSNKTAKRIYEEAIRQVKVKPKEGLVKGERANEPDERELFIPLSPERKVVLPDFPQPSPSAAELSSVVKLEEELHQLRQQLERRERELNELQSDLSESDRELEKATAYVNALEHELNQVKSQSTATADPYEWIVNQRDIWQSEVERLAAELAKAQKSLHAFELMADLYETQESNERTNNQIPGGDGNREWSNGDQPPPVDAELHRPECNGAAIAGSSALG